MRFVNRLFKVSLDFLKYFFAFLGKRSKEGIQKFRNGLHVQVHVNLQFRDYTDVAG